MSKPEPEPERNETIRFGIIGCANIARKVARAICLAPHATLHAVGSRSLEKAERFAASLSAVRRVYGSYGEVLEDSCVDAVYLPLPTGLHLRWAVAAARSKKHVLVEKPTAVDAAELGRIVEECRSNGVQFMDGTMWLHHPRTSEMKRFISDPLFGPINYIYSASTMGVTPEFLETDIRVKPDLDALGALGDLGWYCIGAALWAQNYKLPSTVQALPGTALNSAGIILSCTASLRWSDPVAGAEIHCSFLSHSSMDLTVASARAGIRVTDYIIPCEEARARFGLARGGEAAEVAVEARLPQEALMVEELARIALGIRDLGRGLEEKWPEISMKTQVVLDAVKKSIDRGCESVQL